MQRPASVTLALSTRQTAVATSSDAVIEEPHTRLASWASPNVEPPMQDLEREDHDAERRSEQEVSTEAMPVTDSIRSSARRTSGRHSSHGPRGSVEVAVVCISGGSGLITATSGDAQ